MARHYHSSQPTQAFRQRAYIVTAQDTKDFPTAIELDKQSLVEVLLRAHISGVQRDNNG